MVYATATIDKLSCLIVVDTSIRHQLRPEGTLREAHIFPCPIDVRHRGVRTGLEFPHTDHWYWSLEPSGISTMTLEESDSIGLPRWKFYFLPILNTWREYHYNAIREFSEARGLDPYSNDVARLLGSPFKLAEMESNYPTSNYLVFYGVSLVQGVDLFFADTACETSSESRTSNS
jgi:hypothetical protein